MRVLLDTHIWLWALTDAAAYSLTFLDCVATIIDENLRPSE